MHLLNLGFPIVSDPLYGIERKIALETGKIDERGPVVDSLGNTKEDYERPTAQTCQECGEPVYEDPELFAIHLHARRYQCPLFDFSCDLPKWAERKEHV